MENTYEIECKAWVDDPDTLRGILKLKYEYKSRYVKDDAYYHFPGSKESFRIRRQADDSIITMKKKSRAGGIEENLETEFTVSDVDSFTKFIDEFNCPLYLTKKKTSEVFTYQNITIELSYVETLGWFIEIEKLVRSESASEKKKAKEQILEILHNLSISEEKIEERYYTELLTGQPE